MKQRIVGLGASPRFWLACLLAWLLLSACRSLETPWARAALTEALRWGAGLGLMLVLGTALPRTGPAARWAAALAGLMALAGIWDGFQVERGGVVGPFHDHQLYGSVLLVLLPVPVALALSTREAAWRWGATAIAGAGAVCLALSQTRSAWAGLLTAALVFAGLWAWRSGQTRVQGRLILFPALLLLGGVALLWAVTGPTDLRGLLTQRAATLSSLGTDGSWQGRLTAWRGATRLAETQPLWGVGLGRYPGRQYAWTHAGRPLTPTERPSLSEEAHNFYLQTTAETGLIGLGLYLAALAAFAARCGRRLRQTRGRRMGRRDALLVAVLSLMAGQATDALASPSWQFAEASLFFWALLGLGLAALRAEEPETSPATRPAVSNRSPMPRVWRLAASGALAVVLAANIFPLGLLSPVEAYSNPTAQGYTYNNAASVSSQVTSSSAAGATVVFQILADYRDSQNVSHPQDVTFDGTAPGNFNATQFIVTTAHSPTSGVNAGITAFGTTGPTRNTLTVDPRDFNVSLPVQVKYYIGGVQKSAYTTVKVVH